MDFPGGSAVKNPPANPGGMGPNPGPAGFHMLQHSQAKKAQLQSLGQQKPLQWEAHAPQLESEPHWPQLEEAQVQQQRPSTDKNRNK